MTVEELIERLQREDPRAEVRLMTQPSYPFDNAVAGVWTPEDVNDLECVECGSDPEAPVHEVGAAEASPFGHDFQEPEGFRPKDNFSEPHEGPVVYITEGSQNGYGAREAWS